MGVSKEQMQAWLMRNLGPQPNVIPGKGAFLDFPQTPDAIAEADQRQQSGMVEPTPVAMADDAPVDQTIEGPETLITAQPPAAPSPNSAQSILGAMQPPTSTDLSSFSPERLADAQERANQNRLSTGILGSIANSVATMTGTKPDSETWKNLQAQANQPVTNLSNEQALTKSALQNKALIQSQNPNSPSAAAYKSAIKEMLGDKISDADLAKMTSAQAESFFKSYAPVARLKSMEAYRDANLGLREKGLDIRSGNSIESDANKLKTSLDAAKASGQGPLGRAARRVSTADTILQTFKHKDPNSYTNQELYEMAKDVDAMLSSSGTTLSGVEHLMPPSGALDSLNGFESWFSRSPYPANKGKWVELYSNMANRIKDNSLSQVDQMRGSFRDENSRLFKSNPERYNKIFDNFKEQLRFSHPEDVSGAAQGPAPAASGQIKVKSKADGRIKILDADTANKILQSAPDKYEVAQ